MARRVAYWACTAIIAWEMAVGSVWDLARTEFVRGVFAHLGYPLYLLTILGLWKLPCAPVLLLPRLPRLKEWAYAGAFFNYSGAAASHALVGDGARGWAGPALFAAITLASWALRPLTRRLGPTPTPAPAPGPGPAPS
jgi:DoxX-like family